MEDVRMEHMELLGFGKHFMQAAAAVCDAGKVSFSLSERRHTHRQHLKFVAVLLAKPSDTRIRVLKYHAVNITPAPEGGDGAFLDRLRDIEAAMLKVPFNHASFLNKHAFPIEVARFCQREAEKIRQSLASMPFVSKEDEANKAKLFLKYVHDTVYSLVNPIVAGGPLPYERHFQVLTISEHTGLIPLRDAADLLVTRQMTNEQSVDRVKDAVRDLKAEARQRKRRPRIPRKGRPGKGNTI